MRAYPHAQIVLGTQAIAGGLKDPAVKQPKSRPPARHSADCCAELAWRF
jgi:hypothetical protein